MKNKKNIQEEFTNYEKYAGGFSSQIVSLVPAGSKVLDIGCGSGALAAELLKKNCSTTGIDLSSEALSYADEYCEKTICGNIEHTSSIMDLIKPESFDVITAGDVLEHMIDPWSVVDKLKPLLRDGGLFISSIPNSAFISQRLKFFFGSITYQEGGGIMDIGHLRMFSFNTAKHLFEEAGYKIVAHKGVNTVQDKYFFLRPLGAIYPRLFAIHTIIVAEK